LACCRDGGKHARGTCTNDVKVHIEGIAKRFTQECMPVQSIRLSCVDVITAFS